MPRQVPGPVLHHHGRQGVHKRCPDRVLPTPSCKRTELTLVKWDSTDRSAIQEKKIRVTWLAPSSDGHLDVAATPIRQSQNLSNGVRNIS